MRCISKNQLVVFNPYQVHQTKDTKGKSCDYYTLHIYKKWLDINISKNLYFKENIISSSNYYDEFILLCEDLNLDNIANIEKSIYNFIHKFSLNYGIEKDMDISQSNHIIKCVKRYIIENIKENITLDDIANKIGYSKEYIIRIFKKEFGLTPHAFLMNEKVNYAKKILDERGGKNLSSIALELGFYDQSHFTKYFKKSFAITPQNYIKS